MDGLRVAIVGGGIGGLSAALCLQRFGHHPVLVEQTRELRPVGAGISLWPNGIKVLNLLGLGPRIAALGGTMERMAYADRSGRELLDFPLAELYAGRERARPVARAELQDLLLGEVVAALGADAVRLGTRASEVTDTGDGVTLTTEDGGAIEADVVVAADGTHSRLRDHVAGERIERRYVGYVNWNGLVAESSDIAPIGTWLTWVGEGKRVSVMPIGRGRCYWFADAPMALDAVDSLPDHRAALAEHFDGWAKPVGLLLERMDPASVARVPIHDVQPLATWSRAGRVARRRRPQHGSGSRPGRLPGSRGRVGADPLPLVDQHLCP